MDYLTQPASRNDLRYCAKFFRSICHFTADEPIDPVVLLDQLRDLDGFSDVNYEIVEDSILPGNVPAQCIMSEENYLIQIKESVYIGAYEKKIGGHRMHIMHEIMHVFADKLGFSPILTRQLTDETPCFRRLEWIVKVLAGEVMMPYEATQNMSVSDIMNVYGVSKSAAETRLKY